MRFESIRSTRLAAIAATAVLFAAFCRADAQDVSAERDTTTIERTFAPRPLRPILPSSLVFWQEEERQQPLEPRSEPLARRNPLRNLLNVPIAVLSLEAIPGFGAGQVSVNGSFPDTNTYSAAGASYRLGISPDDSTLSRDIGRFPALTAAGGLNSLAPLSLTQSLFVRMSSVEQQSPGAAFMFTSKGAENRFHASFFEYFGHDQLNAADPFAKAAGLRRGALRSNLFGGAVSGGFWPDAAWIRFGYEGLRLRQPAFALTEVPSNDVRNAANIAIANYLRAFPVANRGATDDGFGLFAETFANPADHDIFDLRINTRLMDFTTVYEFRLADSSAAVRADRGFAASTTREFAVRTESHTLSAGRYGNGSTDLRGYFSYSRNLVSQSFETNGLVGGNPFSGAPAGFFRFDLGGFGTSVIAAPRIAATTRRIDAGGGVRFRVAQHQIDFGATFSRFDAKPGLSSTETRLSLAGANSALSGTVSRLVTFERRQARSGESSFGSIFARGNSVLFNRLSLSYGVLWSLDFPGRRDASSFVYQNGAVRIPNSTGNFAPRIAAAWNYQNHSFRAGAGLYFDLEAARAAESDASSFPSLSGLFAFDSPVGTVPANRISPLALFDHNLKTPRSWQIHGEYGLYLPRNLGVFLAGYLETFGRNLLRTRTFDDPGTAFRPIRLTESEGSSRFRALRVSWTSGRAENHRLLVSYSLAKSVDNAPRDTMSDFRNQLAFDDRAASDFDIRQVLTASFTWELPVVFDGDILEKLTEDWNLSIISQARSSAPISVGTVRLRGFGNEFAAADLLPNAAVRVQNGGDQILSAAAFRRAAPGTNGNTGRNSVRGFAFFQTDVSVKRRIRTSSRGGLELSVTAENILNTVNRSDVSGVLGIEYPDGTFKPNRFFGVATGIVGGNGFTAFNQNGGPRSLTLGLRFLF